LKKSLVSRLFLDRMGVEYVERIDKARGVIDAQRLVESLWRRESLFIFPEGTFQETPGLINFHMGAFLTAAEAKVPIVPIAIRGTRSILRGNSGFARRGRITVTIGEAIEPDEVPEKETGDRWKTAIQLRALARKQILRYCGEPEVAKVEG
jgi:1-acyl-sn-glycerol-3-phosphate acyltransferase